MKILLTGATGQLGQALAPELARHGEVIATDRATLDLADAAAIARVVRATTPALIVNAAAYTAVDKAETDEATAQAINGTAPGVLADEARRAGALLLHYSTDYVFDGRDAAPYREDHPTAPCNAYGRSKLQGERAIAHSGAAALVLRTSWVYGRRGHNFLVTMQRLARERNEIRVVDDQRGTPNWTVSLARATSKLIDLGPGALAERAGTYNLTAQGETTWFGFASAIIDAGKRRGAIAPTLRVLPIASAQYPTPAMRPANSVLDDARFAATFGFRLPAWGDALAECLSSGGDA